MRCARTALRLAGVALLISATAGPGTEAASSAELARERALAARVSRDRALAMVRELVALGPRMGGTASGDRAAGAVAAAFQAAGLPVEIVVDPPDRVHEET